MSEPSTNIFAFATKPSELDTAILTQETATTWFKNLAHATESSNGSPHPAHGIKHLTLDLALHGLGGSTTPAHYLGNVVSDHENLLSIPDLTDLSTSTVLSSVSAPDSDDVRAKITFRDSFDFLQSHQTACNLADTILDNIPVPMYCTPLSDSPWLQYERTLHVDHAKDSLLWSSLTKSRLLNPNEHKCGEQQRHTKRYLNIAHLSTMLKLRFLRGTESDPETDPDLMRPKPLVLVEEDVDYWMRQSNFVSKLGRSSRSDTVDLILVHATEDNLRMVKSVLGSICQKQPDVNFDQVSCA